MFEGCKKRKTPTMHQAGPGVLEFQCGACRTGRLASCALARDVASRTMNPGFLSHSRPLSCRPYGSSNCHAENRSAGVELIFVAALAYHRLDCLRVLAL